MGCEPGAGIIEQLAAGDDMNFVTTLTQVIGQIAEELARRRFIWIEITVYKYQSGHGLTPRRRAGRIAANYIL